MILIATRRILEHALHLADSASDVVVHVMAATKDLVEKRALWLNPEGASEVELKKRTLTNLYNHHPTWLDLANRTLDQAVLAVYAWPHDISDEDILERASVTGTSEATSQTGDVA